MRKAGFASPSSLTRLPRRPRKIWARCFFARGCHAEAAPPLQQALAGASVQARPVIEQILARCEAEGHSAEPSASVAPVSNEETPATASAVTPAQQARRWDSSLSYENWARAVFRQDVPVPGVRIACSWNEDTEWGLRAHNALAQVECEYVMKLLTEIRDQNVPGDIVEFGIFQGWWVNFLYRATEELSPDRRISSTRASTTKI
jgi:hypothetical protein